MDGAGIVFFVGLVMGLVLGYMFGADALKKKKGKAEAQKDHPDYGDKTPY